MFLYIIYYFYIINSHIIYVIIVYIIMLYIIYMYKSEDVARYLTLPPLKYFVSFNFLKGSHFTLSLKI